MRFSVLASGSKGNACYIETDNTKILIDAGLSCRELTRRLGLIGVVITSFDAIIITHEHSDHTKGAGPVSRKFDSTVYGNISTLSRCHNLKKNTKIDTSINTGGTFKINDITIKTFAKSHDAADPVGLIVSSNGFRLEVLTDTGESSPVLEKMLQGCTSLMLEFNHDVEMLENGPYPYHLKKRIRGAYGHLSNEQAGDLLKKLSHNRLNNVVLAHLSEINNTPEKALSQAKASLLECSMDDIPVHVSYQDYPCPLIEV
ncbi:MAG: MBL fold metallo-hydrolase [Deltaproteobacteria bacterium]|nr:MBL fold metallo-hydrolase [Deltaproteobacteria bacterium]